MSAPTEPSLYGLDIEADTATGGLDPARSAVLSVAVASAHGVWAVDDGDEESLLGALFAHLRSLPAGVLVTWNGSGFDWPFLATRAAHLGLASELVLVEDPTRAAKYRPVGGLAHPVRVAFGHLDHLDVALAYRTWAAIHYVDWSLKPVAAALGLDARSVERTAVHELAAPDRLAYVASDAIVTRRLAARLDAAERESWRDRLAGTGDGRR